MNHMICTPLVKALNADNLSEFKRLLDTGKSINLHDNLGYTPLHLAVIRENERFVDYILSVDKSSVNTPNHQGETSLYTASKLGNATIMEKLVIAGADVNIPNCHADTALHAACQTKKINKIEPVRILLEHGIDIDAPDMNGYTPLHIAAENNCRELVDYLLCKGANPNLTEYNGLNPLMIGFMGRLDCAKALLPVTANINQQADDGWSALLLALNCTYITNDIIDELLERGATPSVIATEVTPLTLAVSLNKPQLVERLYELFDERVYTNSSKTFLHAMIEKKWYKLYPESFQRMIDNPKMKYIIAHTKNNETYIGDLFSVYYKPDANLLSLFKKFLQLGAPVGISTLQTFMAFYFHQNAHLIPEFMELVLYNCGLSEVEVLETALMFSPEVLTVLLQYLVKVSALDIFLHVRVGEMATRVLFMHCTPPRGKVLQLYKEAKRLRHLGSEEFCEMASCLFPHVPTLVELARDSIRRVIGDRVGSIKEYKEFMATWNVPRPIKDIIQQVHPINDPALLATRLI